MEFILVVAALAVGLFIFAKWRARERGKTFVRAVTYVELLRAGQSVDAANFITMMMFSRVSNPEEDQKAILHAVQISQTQFGGQQLPIVAFARSRGFNQ